jgi:septum site-determining protein MinD
MSERTVYAIASGKGGVGKTTTAINLGAMLADRDHSVVVVDTDLGMANLADFLDFEVETPTLHEVLAGDADAEDAIHRAPGGIDVLPTATDIEAFTRSDAGNLEDVVAPLRDEYDVVLLDTGAGVSYDTLVPLALADAVLLVATPDVASVRDTAKTGKLAARVESEVAGAVLTQRSSDILNADDVEETLGTDVLAVVPEDEAVPMGIDAGRPLAVFAPNAPAGRAYRDLAAVVTGDADPDPELDLGGDADVEFDADPPTREKGSGEREDAPPGDGLAESVQNAIESGGESGGLLGGELASAAEEIRAQSADQTAERATDAPTEGSDESEGGRAMQADPTGSDADGSNQTDAEADESEPAESDATDEEARSVDDLIDEHMDDDGLGDDPFGGDDSRDDADDGDYLGDADESDETSDGTPADESVSESIPFEGETDSASAEEDGEAGGSKRTETGSAKAQTNPRGSQANTEAAQANSKDSETESKDVGAEPQPDAERESGDVESGDVEADGVKTGTLDDGDDSAGILGRIGSLFK